MKIASDSALHDLSTGFTAVQSIFRINVGGCAKPYIAVTVCVCGAGRGDFGGYGPGGGGGGGYGQGG